MKIICTHNNPDNLPPLISSDFDFGLKLQKEYVVMGMLLKDKKILFFIDEDRKPSFYPQEIFKISDSCLSSTWHFKAYSQNDEMFPYAQAVWGYYEFCFDQYHYERLIDRDPKAMKLYFERKQEQIDKYNKNTL